MVIVGTDFSRSAARALAKARALALELDEQVEIVHVRQSRHPDAWSPDEIERDWLREVGEPGGKITIRYGTPWVELVRIADERGARMIVVGTHGRSGFHTLALGTTATRLALLSPHLTMLVSESLLRRTACVTAVPYDPPIHLDRRKG